MIPNGRRFTCSAVLIAATLSPQPTAPWIARADGVGAVRVGMRVGPTARLLNATARTERIEPDESCGQAFLSTAPTGVSFMVEGDTIVRVDIDSVGVKTEAGVGVGDTEADVRTRYKKLAKISAHPYEGPKGHYITVDRAGDRRYRMIFETNGKIVTRYRVGRRDAVDLIEGCA